MIIHWVVYNENYQLVDNTTLLAQFPKYHSKCLSVKNTIQLFTFAMGINENYIPLKNKLSTSPTAWLIIYLSTLPTAQIDRSFLLVYDFHYAPWCMWITVYYTKFKHVVIEDGLVIHAVVEEKLSQFEGGSSNISELKKLIWQGYGIYIYIISG